MPQQRNRLIVPVQYERVVCGHHAIVAAAHVLHMQTVELGVTNATILSDIFPQQPNITSVVRGAAHHDGAGDVLGDDTDDGGKSEGPDQPQHVHQV